MADSTYKLKCRKCADIKNPIEESHSYEKLKDSQDAHHIRTGHNPKIDEELHTSPSFVVKCDRCDFSEPTNSYERAKDLVDTHHIPTGHNPRIEE